ncbi:hypothetical protein PV797_21010 [Clostridiaceae bacterium M8S5]|nr:hypothetical protein PV797_21010 [Clostridiaceae bacterium M8S5]
MVVLVDILKNIYSNLIEIVKYKKEYDKEFFSKLIEPTYDSFKIVHKNYLEDFSKYRNKLNNTSNFTIDFANALIDDIYSDSLYTQSLRAQLVIFCKHEKRKRKFKKIKPFMDAIKRYLIFCSKIEPDIVHIHIPDELRDFENIRFIEEMGRIELNDLEIEQIVNEYNKSGGNVWRHTTIAILKDKINKINSRELNSNISLKNEAIKEIDKIIKQLQQKFFLVEEAYFVYKNNLK